MQILNALERDNDTGSSSFHELSIYRPCAQLLLALLFALMTCDVVAQSAAEKYGDPSLLEAPDVDPIMYPKGLEYKAKVVLELIINRKGLVERGKTLISELDGESIINEDDANTAKFRFERSALWAAQTARYTTSIRKSRVRKMTVVFNQPPCTDPPQTSGEVIVQVCAPLPLPPMDCCIRYIPTLDVPNEPELDLGIPPPTLDISDRPSKKKKKQ
jgi:hypothetical protein